MRENSRFNRRIKNLPEAIWRRIAQIDELKGRWATGASLSPQALGRLKQSVLVTSTGASTRIEGARLSDEEVEKLMRGIAVRKFRDRDRQEVRGYYELLANVFESWETVKFSDGMIKRPRSGRNPRACPWRNEPPRSGQAKLVKFASATALAVGIYSPPYHPAPCRHWRAAQYPH